MAYIDAGMDRTAYSTTDDYAKVYADMESGKPDVGVLIFENVAIFQDLLIDGVAGRLFTSMLGIHQ